MYIVTGASGQTGSIVAKTLLEKNLPVRAIVRSAAKGEVWRASGAEVAVAEIHDRAALSAAFEGGKVLYWLNPPNYQSEDMFAETERNMEVFKEALSGSTIEKVVALSSVGAHLTHGTGVIGTLRLMEEAIKSSGVPAVFMRPPSFMENWNSVLDAVRHEGVLPSMHLPLDHQFPQISVADIGRLAAETMLEDANGESVKELAGFLYSPNEVAAALAKVFGKDVRAVPVPEEAWPEILSAFCSEKNAAAMIEMYRGINAGTITFETENQIQGKVTIEDYAGKLR